MSTFYLSSRLHYIYNSMYVANKDFGGGIKVMSSDNWLLNAYQNTPIYCSVHAHARAWATNNNPFVPEGSDFETAYVWEIIDIFGRHPGWKKKFLSLGDSEYDYESQTGVINNFCRQIDERLRKEYSPEQKTNVFS